jgi:hypothetical protein
MFVSLPADSYSDDNGILFSRKAHQINLDGITVAYCNNPTVFEASRS